MFHKLHLHLTLFFTSVTGLILVVLSCACLLISENGIRQNTLISFEKERSSLITHLQMQSVYSFQWATQVQETNHYYLYLYDNGNPFYAERLYADDERDALVSRVLSYAKSDCRIDIAQTFSDVLPKYADFSVTDEKGEPFYASVGVIPKNENALGFVLLYPLSHQKQQILSERLLFATADLGTICFLFLFSWFFTKKMLHPLEENRRKQIDFTASASHELRAPLTVILSGAEALTKTETKEEREHFWKIIQAEGTRMRHLISDLLLLTHSDTGRLSLQYRDCQPELLLLDAYEKYESAASRKRLSLSVQLPDEALPAHSADAERIAQLLSILLDNALSYTPAGGAVTLSLSAEQTGSLFRISDNGPAIPDDQKELIFERFYRAQDSHTDKTHFGLGLCIAREIADAHHGRLWVEDETGGGTCFCFLLPQKRNLLFLL